MKRSIQAYKKISIDSQINDASPHKVILMLLNGAMERLIQARAAMENKDIAVKGERIGKALNIVISLKSSLSLDEGGEVAQNLDDLYAYIIRQISIANKDNTVEPLSECIDILREIKTAWEQIPAKFHNITPSDE